MTTNYTDAPQFSQPDATVEQVRLEWIVASIKREREINRRALLARLEVLEAEMGISPTTKEIREQWKQMRGEA